jgi:hypothetical protein
MQQDAQARNEQDNPYSQKINLKELICLLTIIVQMGHDHKPSKKLYWTKDEFSHVAFYYGVMPHDFFLMILKYLHFTDNWNPPTKDREDRL